MTQLDDITVKDVDVLVIGGGTAGPMAAITAKEKDPSASVMLLEKANVKRSGAISMGMDGLNNAVIPGHATPEQYTKEITIANDGIVLQKGVMEYAERSFDMIQKLDNWGVYFQKDETGEYDVKKVHHLGTYVLPMPEGHNIKKILYRRLRRNRVQVENRYQAIRLMKDESGAVSGCIALGTRDAEVIVIRAKAVVLCTGAAGRIGLPASGYLYGTYENPTNCGDGHSMAYHVGAELSGLECYQINPLLKDYNGPACAYVTGPLGGYTANANGDRFIECDYWSGQMMMEFYNELQSGNGPVFLKLDHLAEETIQEIEDVLHTNERPSRGRFHDGRGNDYRTKMVEMHISEIGFCAGHSASGVWINEKGETTVPGLYGAGDMASIPHSYMLGAFVYGDICGANAVEFAKHRDLPTLDETFILREKQRILAPLKRSDGIPPNQFEYKLRRFVNDYLQPPKITKKMDIGLQRLKDMEQDIEFLYARDPHELLRANEAQHVYDCALMAAHASMYRQESRWGLYHHYVDYPQTNNDDWFCHVQLYKSEDNQMACKKRPIDPYVVELDEEEKTAYQKMRIQQVS
ncbi:MAG: fumarate reductase/succinate dehydrogenase flavoprotein subunit [Pseudomonadales bacterium]|uniref:fumarate reductase/succinate dehydrogenase flavoprotein subunit n=1 Tax=unclassified Ketobacter TaxID=2639109 RepID=UPI000C936174|nr:MULTISPECIES: fumarate reductase/succinate dehydrogenase flavoprotein subunit [unclassified Ketobacter]MAQ23604.1 fumarate reductase/succinate dehydrogenase flavoprotein subunit [Pseudomonadales bacterium]MEC8812840.1 fumarate reductase/succinate dehydrogenase flavoprotein subunit [Pseudomonadota bacterium]TNC90803.1 MAG: fumarate reductase/succinate dehydrogenase flavoprotein subunit [Alcanivorax sp.]HAU12905.1 fumarate reductase/succinate dehydrogenase flavoprotein subunit [Gammaproteobact